MEATCLGKQRGHSDNKAVIKTGRTAFFAYMLALLVFFLCAGPVDAHDLGLGDHPSGEHPDNSITVDDVVNSADEEQVKALLVHAKAHYSQITVFPKWSEFRGLLQTDGGDWRRDTMYMLRMSRGVLNHHPYYPAQSGTLHNLKDDNGQLVMQKLTEAAAEADPQPGCVPYTLDGEQRVACAVNFESNLGRRTPFLLVSGLHHKFEQVSFAGLKCPYYDVAGKTIAADVVDEESLEKFVKEFAEFYLGLRNEVGVIAIVNFLNCFRVSPWRSGPIYLWWMFEENKNVLFNGLDPALESTFLDVRDEAGNDVGNLIVETAKDLPIAEGEQISEGVFVKYLWDNPVKDGDEVRDDQGNPVPGKAPGNSPKTGYFVKIPADSGQTLIVGSGIYPDAEEDDGGCAIAGSGDTPRSAIFNLFLIASTLFSATLWKNRSRKKTVTKSKGRAAVLVCALVLPVFFSGTLAAGAQDSSPITADSVDLTDMESVRNFVLRAKAHWESITDPNENIEFENELTMDGGDWKNGSIYLIVIDERAVIFTQPHLPQAQNGALLSKFFHDGRRQVRTISPEVQALIEAAGTGGNMGGCVANNAGQYSCAVKFNHPVWKSELILIGGYDHSLDDVVFDPVVCPYYISETINAPPYFKQGIDADKVVDSDTLKEFVGEFAKHFDEQIDQAGQTSAQLARVRNCWRTLPWKYEGIYVFIMTESNLVFFNGNGPHLENRSFNLMDGNGCDVGNEVIRVARGEDRQCKDLGLLPENAEGFVEYLWDDPTDDVPPRIEEGMAPGDMPKLSYVVRYSHPDFLGGETLIIGSGLHPGVSGGDGGCAIAGSGNTAKSALFNPFLILLVLFSAALWKNRSSSGSFG